MFKPNFQYTHDDQVDDSVDEIDEIKDFIEIHIPKMDSPEKVYSFFKGQDTKPQTHPTKEKKPGV